MSKELKKREEIDEKYKWNLNDIYEDDQKFETELDNVLVEVKKIKEIKDDFTDSADKLLSSLNKIIKIEEKTAKLYTYAHMKYDQNTQNEKYQSYKNKAMMVYNKLSNSTAFMVPAIIQLGEEKLESYKSENEELEFFNHFFDNILRQKEHYLSAEEEKILALAGEVTQSSENIFSMLNNADLEFPLIKDENNEELRLTHGRYIDLLKNENRRVREDAFEGMHGEYEDLENAFAAVLDSSVKGDVFYARARKYDSALESALDNDNISTAVYNNLIDTVSDNLEPLHQYMKLKKEMLKLDELHIYDTYTPLIKEIDLKFKYQETKDIIKEAVKPLGEDYINKVEEGFNSGWIDVYENKGKRSGAYSSGCYGVHPYILMNYTQDISNLFTLIHEMGHAMHSYYANKNQPYLYADYKIFVAEVASTLNENLLLDYMLDNAESREEKLYLLNYFLEGFRGTVYRQTMFAEFEKMIHESVESGESLTSQAMKTMYRKLNQKYFGEVLVIDQKLDYEWARIPHFYYNFYVYKYATGYSAAAALADKIQSEGPETAANYLEFLKAGGSDYPLNILRKAGVDMEKSDAIENAAAKFKKYLKQLQELI
ncbi:oligoendopeptidase F [Halanaerobium saccharolyticum]|uniref:Oligopeptidase F n=1 Tax=Halanaerobium saccharolyticum TaxID=43595 RepID=A0A4R7Z8E1_9FIRM|nr:oligoendopeptidase F [Halanaerobium saccharolyticum]RAK11149.1 oligoendopeptidase F [Halanaerobium saccharolyticum]TDW07000.1 oligoendopeptidase F [Halanaerobium saccharolyticum]TDX63765.1 oligoendopeptidase F [Halanaerobium saccharolyticum]